MPNTDKSVSAGTVTISTINGANSSKVFNSSTFSNQQSATVDIPKSDKPLLVEISNIQQAGNVSFDGTLKAIFFPGDSSPLNVNPVSTIKAEYYLASLGSSPAPTSAQVDERIRKLLGLSPVYNLDQSFMSSAKQFSSARFLSQAAANHGFNAYARQIAQQALGDSQYSVDFKSQALMAGVGPSGLAWVGEQLAAGVIGAVGAQAANAAFGALGLTSDPNAPVLKAISDLKQQLLGINDQLNNISGDLTGLSREMQKGIYATTAGPLVPYVTRIDKMMGTMSRLAALPTPTKGSAEEIQDIADVTALYDDICTFVTENSGANKDTMMAVIAGSSGSGLPYIAAQANKIYTTGKRFYTRTDEANYQAIMQFWMSKMQALYVLTDLYYTQGYVPSGTGRGNCSAKTSDVNRQENHDARRVAAHEFQTDLARIQQSMAARLPPADWRGDIFIDTDHNLMVAQPFTELHYSSDVSNYFYMIMGCDLGGPGPSDPWWDSHNGNCFSTGSEVPAALGMMPLPDFKTKTPADVFGDYAMDHPGFRRPKYTELDKMFGDITGSADLFWQHLASKGFPGDSSYLFNDPRYNTRPFVIDAFEYIQGGYGGAPCWAPAQPFGIMNVRFGAYYGAIDHSSGCAQDYSRLVVPVTGLNPSGAEPMNDMAARMAAQYFKRVIAMPVRSLTTAEISTPGQRLFYKPSAQEEAASQAASQ